MAGPTHVDDDAITAGILRQNTQTSLKGASAICHRSDGAVPTRSAWFLHNAERLLWGRKQKFKHGVIGGSNASKV